MLVFLVFLRLFIRMNFCGRIFSRLVGKSFFRPPQNTYMLFFLFQVSSSTSLTFCGAFMILRIFGLVLLNAINPFLDVYCCLISLLLLPILSFIILNPILCVVALRLLFICFLSVLLLNIFGNFSTLMVFLYY